jgi:hypothetical protein
MDKTEAFEPSSLIMNAGVEQRPISISLLALPESTPTALYGLYEVLSSVGG